MKRLVPLVVLAALALAASACDLSPPALRAGGVSVSRARLDSALSSVAGSAEAQCALGALAQQSGTTLPAVAGTGDDTVTTQFAAFVLSGFVRQAVEAGLLARHHAAVGAADVAAARRDYLAQVDVATSQAASPCGLSGTALTDRLPKAFVDQQAGLLATEEKVEQVVGNVQVSDAALRRYYDTHQADFTEQCLNLIVAQDQASAQVIHDEVAGGATFAAAAQGPGVNPNGPPGGEEPCVLPSVIANQLGSGVAAAVANLPVGQVAPPQSLTVTSQTGQSTTLWIVVGMRKRQLAPYSSVAEGLRLQLLQQGQSRVTPVLARAARQLQVHLDPRYGTWSARNGVVPPPTPPAALLLNPGAGTGSGSSSLVLPGG